MRRKTYLSLAPLCALAAYAFVGSAMAQGEAATAKFLEDAIRSNIAEIKMGELGEQRAQSPEVRNLAHRIVEDHTAALRKTSDLAKSFRIIPPTEPKAEAIRQHEAMSKLSGEEFERAFVDHMVIAHQQAITEYLEQARNAPRPEVMELAEATLPTLREHLAAAAALQRNQGSG